MLSRRRFGFVFWVGLALSPPIGACADPEATDPEATGLAVPITLTRDNAARYAPAGRESDWIYGDIAMQSDRVTAVIARPVAGRNANWVLTGVGCSLIDLSDSAESDDLLSLFSPGGRDLEYRPAVGQSLSLEADGSGGREFRCIAKPSDGSPEVALRYRLVGDVLEVETIYTHRGEGMLVVEPHDLMRAEETFQKPGDESGRGQVNLLWAYDRWSGRAYGVASQAHTIRFESDWRSAKLYYERRDGREIRLGPGESYRLVRQIRVARDLLELRAQFQQERGIELHDLRISVVDPQGGVAGAELSVSTASGALRGVGLSADDGQLALRLPAGRYQLRASALGRGRSGAVSVEVPGTSELSLRLLAASFVEVDIRDEGGRPIPVKVQFLGMGETASPNFGPAQGEHAVRNLYYSHDGRFRQIVEPGRYRLIVSRGPEYDAVQRVIEVVRGETTTVSARLRRSVDTSGWVSADMHGHSTESGDTSASQRGRVLNLLAEHIEFAPATEHNRVSDYATQIAALGATAFVATAAGVELTGGIPMNHQNAFPLLARLRTQDGGAPAAGDPEAQIRRLALFDAPGEKLVQQNHPDLFQILYDRDQDGRADGGYSGMLPFIDIMEIYPLARFLNQEHSQKRDSRMLLWLQLLNRGERIPGVINTDAHSNFHGSGARRNFIRSETDDPGQLDPLDLVRELKRGHIVMSSGPFLEVAMRSGTITAIPGDDLEAPGGLAELSVRVQCPNWFDIDRVQVLLNGRFAPELNFTRATTPELFSDDNVRFAATFPLALERDTHVVVLTAGEQSRLGLVMGRQNAGITPMAVANPIFVDVDGNGFQPNHDRLGVELPIGAAWPGGS